MASPVTVDDLRKYLNLDGEEPSEVLQSLLDFATDYIERETGQRLLERADTLVMSEFPADSREIVLPWPPLASVDSVKYMTGGVETVFASGNYHVDTTNRPGRLRLAEGADWPDIDDRPDAVRIEYTAGYGGSSDVPPMLLQAVKWMAAHAWENREATTDKPLSEAPLAVRSVIESHMFREAYAA